MISLYTPERAERMGRRARLGCALAWSLSLCALAACVLLCLNTRTGNESRMFVSTVAVSTLGGWTVMALLFFFSFPSRAEYRHMRGILQGEAEEAEGVLSLTDAYFAIPHSITVRRATMESDGKTLALQADAALSRALPPSGSRVRVRVVRKYITAWEACDADAEKTV